VSNSKIKRAKLDGTDVQTILSSPASRNFGGIAFDLANGQLYSGDGSTLFRVNLDGSGRTLLESGTSVTDVELDLVHGKVYWSDNSSDRINRANLDGSSFETIRTLSSVDNVEGLAVNPTGGKLYLAFGSNPAIYQIRMMNLDGTGWSLFKTLSGPLVALDTELDAVQGWLYWNPNGGAGTIQRTRLSGSGPVETFLTPTNGNGNGFHFDPFDRDIYYFGLRTNVGPSDLCRIPGGSTNIDYLVVEPDRLNYVEVMHPLGIRTSPASQLATAGTDVLLQAEAYGVGPLSYQWLRDGAPLAASAQITGTTHSKLDIARIQLTDVGAYALVVSNTFGMVTSAVAHLRVTLGPLAFAGLGDLPGGVFASEATAVSADGSVVVGTGRSAAGEEAFGWDGGPLTGLGDLPAGRFLSRANDVSGDGATVVGLSSSTPPPQSNGYDYEAFQWRSNQLAGLGFIPSFEYSSATAVSADGTIVVGSAFHNNGGRPAKWNIGVGSLLPSLPGHDTGLAFGISRDGSVIVGRSTVSTISLAVRWDGDTVTSLGDLAGGNQHSQALDVSIDGSVIVGRATSSSGGEAFRWQDGAMTGLGDLAGGAFESAANAVSGDGRIVVGYGTTTQGSEAFIWDVARGMRKLRDVLVNEFGLDLAGWTLEEAHDISFDGTTIVGRGRNPLGQTEAWVTRIPVAPGIASRSAYLTVSAGANAIFRVEPTGTPPHAYRWFFNGASVADASGAALTLTNVTLSQAGLYSVVVSNAFGAVTNPFVLSLVEMSRPAGPQQPDQVFIAGPTHLPNTVRSRDELSPGRSWSILTTNLVLPASPHQFTDPGATNAPRRFYQAFPTP
jgi:probable HAF family extracellular repeat protein